jgi:hypothetical protein
LFSTGVYDKSPSNRIVRNKGQVERSKTSMRRRTPRRTQRKSYSRTKATERGVKKEMNLAAATGIRRDHSRRKD